MKGVQEFSLIFATSFVNLKLLLNEEFKKWALKDYR